MPTCKCKRYKPKQKNEVHLKAIWLKKMNEIKDTVQVGIANSTAIGISIVQVNEILTFISLVLAISYTIYKFTKFDKK